MSARLQSFIASPPRASGRAPRGPLPLSPPPDADELVSRAQAAAGPEDRALGGSRAGVAGVAGERSRGSDKPDITKAAKFIFEYQNGITGNCKVLYLEKTVTVQAPRTRSGAHDVSALVRMVDSCDWMDASDDDDRSILQTRPRSSGAGVAQQMQLADIIQACQHQDNCLIFGVKELRNSLSSAGYRYWKQSDVEEIYLPATLEVKLSAQHKMAYTLRGASEANLWIVYCRRGALPCEFACEGGMIIDRGKFALAPQPERKPRKKADPDQEKVKKPRSSNASGGAGGRGAGGRGAAQSLAGPVNGAGRVVRKALGSEGGLDVWGSESDSDSNSDGCGGARRPADQGGRSAAEALHERKILQKLDRFMGREDEAAAPGNPVASDQPAGQPHNNTAAAAPAGDDDDWVTV